MIADALEDWAKKATIQTLPQLLAASAERWPERPYLGARVEGAYRWLTYRQVRARVHEVARALVELGLQPGERVAQLVADRPEWAIFDQAAAHAGLVHVPVDPGLPADTLAHILHDSEARLLVMGSAGPLERLGELSHLRFLVTFEPAPAAGGFERLRWDDLRGSDQAEVERRAAALEAGTLASLVYTSGTTGPPRGAMLRHGNFVSNALAAGSLLDIGPHDRQLSFMPLSHVFERVLLYALTGLGASIAYAESVETLARDLVEVRPTVLASVPRLYEAVQAGVAESARQGGELQRTLYRWSMEVGRRFFEAERPSRSLQLQRRFAYKLVLSRIRARLGGRIRYLLCGGAPLRPEVGAFFLHAGMKLLEGYGLTETGPIVSVNPPERIKLGTVGTPLPGVEVLIASDGEILVRGPNVMQGYFRQPEATREALDPDGWLHTGDLGFFDGDGFLHVTGRKKEQIALTTGKKVAPGPLEERLRSSPLIAQAVVVGEQRDYVAALVVPDGVALGGSLEELAQSPEARRRVQTEVDRLCASLPAPEKVRKVVLLPRELTREAGDLTPTFKVRRALVLERFAREVEELYRS